jgi:hypothetical protein
MVRMRTAAADLISGALDAALAALHAAGLSADLQAPSVGPSLGPDPEIDVRVDERAFTLSVAVKSYCTGQVATHLTQQAGVSGGPFRLLVADRITSEARFILDQAGWSWLDRRGRLHLRVPGVRVDVDVPALDRSPASNPGPPVKGRSGLTIAYWLCAHPGHALSPNRSSSHLRLAPSTISITVRHLADAGLVDEFGAAIAPELFWELSAAWHTERTWLLRAPEPHAHMPSDPDAPSWRITGTEVAAHYGAPVVAAGEGPIELYVNGPVDVSIAVRRYGVAEPGTGAAVVAVPPTSLINSPADGDLSPIIHGWPAAPMVAVALDLAQDRSRGREILSDWKDGHGIWN